MRTIDQEILRAGALKLARDYGYTHAEADDRGPIAPLGRFEGEPFYAVYFWYRVLDGEGDEPLYDGETIAADILEVTDDEVAAFELEHSTTFVALWYSDTGFIHLDELTAGQYDELRAAYDD